MSHRFLLTERTVTLIAHKAERAGLRLKLQLRRWLDRVHRLKNVTQVGDRKRIGIPQNLVGFCDEQLVLDRTSKTSINGVMFISIIGAPSSEPPDIAIVFYS